VALRVPVYIKGHELLFWPFRNSNVVVQPGQVDVEGEVWKGLNTRVAWPGISSDATGCLRRCRLCRQTRDLGVAVVHRHLQRCESQQIGAGIHHKVEVEVQVSYVSQPGLGRVVPMSDLAGLGARTPQLAATKEVL
jgi:hypothetical protein